MLDKTQAYLLKSCQLPERMDRVAVRQNTAPYKIAQAFKMVSEQFVIQLPADFVKVAEYEQMSLDFSKGGGAA